MDSSSQRRQISHEGLEPHGRHISYDHTQDDYFSTLLNSTLRKQNYKARTVRQCLATLSIHRSTELQKLFTIHGQLTLIMYYFTFTILSK